jgi:CHAT domain-containing protein
VRAQLRGSESLVIVPDGPLWELPFQALQPTAEHYLLEECALSYAPSLTVLREVSRLRRKLAAQPRGPDTLLAFGNPGAGRETARAAPAARRDEGLGPLPEAEKEVLALGRLYGADRSRIYVGAEAREERLKQEVSGYRILHMATHGILNDAAPMYSQIVLSPPGRGAREDGLLESWEVMNLDLRADLVVLSACETARGRFGAGEGMIGLTWALFVAGTPGAVVSQWKVETTSTTELMTEFHRLYLTRAARGWVTHAAARALRQSALGLMRNPKYRHPFYWAGFVVVGDAG